MYQFKKVCKVFAFALILSMATPSISSIENVTVAQAATIRLNHAKLTLDVGETKKLEVKGTAKKAKWATSNEEIATVAKNGIVKAIMAGKVTITATVNKKQYTCKITINETNPYVLNAPFKAKKISFGKLESVIPCDWQENVFAEQGNSSAILLYPSSADLTKGTSNIIVTLAETDKPQMEYSEVKTYLDGLITQDYILSQLSAEGIEATLSDFVVSDFKTTLGTAYKVDYTVNYTAGTSNTEKDAKQSSKVTYMQTIYCLYIDNYFIQLYITKNNARITPDIDSVGQYMLNSFMVNE